MWSINCFGHEGQDHEAVNFPLVNKPIWVILSLLSVYILFGLKLGPEFMKKRKPYDVRPFVIIFNGIYFGIYLFGAVLIWWLLRVDFVGWNYYKGFSHTLTQFFTLRIGYIYMILEMFKIIYVVMWILKKKDTRKVQLYTLDSAGDIFISYYSLRYHPVGPFALRVYAYTVINSFKMIYYILATVGKNFTPASWYKGSLLLLEVYLQLLIFKYFYLESLLQIPLAIKLIIMGWALTHAGQALLSLKYMMINKKYPQ